MPRALYRKRSALWLIGSIKLAGLLKAYSGDYAVAFNYRTTSKLCGVDLCMHTSAMAQRDPRPQPVKQTHIDSPVVNSSLRVDIFTP